MADSDSEAFDVIVVGAGNAAFAAALGAHEEGASVAVLEKATKELRGGNTRFTGGIIRTSFNKLEDLIPVVKDNDNPKKFVSLPYTREDYLNDIERVCGGRSDKALVELLVDKSLETTRWMADLGVKIEFNKLGSLAKDEKGRIKIPFGGPVRTVHEGLGLSDDWFRIAEEVGIPVMYETAFQKVVPTPKGGVAGVEVRGPGGVRRLRCRALVMASGGFQSSPEMRTAYMGPHWSLVKVRGTRFDTGEAIKSLFDLGAQSYGEFSGAHATPIDADAPAYGDLELTDKTNRLSYPFSGMVNLDGERFVDEGEDVKLYTYAKTGRAILAQRSAFALQIFDSKVFQYLEPRYSTAKPVEADTLEGLADRIESRYGHLDFRKETFLKTLRGFNDAVQDGDFRPDVKDGKRTKGLRLEKTNWAQRLDAPPFRAYSATCGITFTYGGVRINTNAEVVDQIDRPIPGLFATGEMTGGFFYQNYPAGAGLMRGAVYGRIAGRNAAAFTRGA